MNRITIISFLLLPLLLVLGACQSQQPGPANVKLGKPYVVGGKTYYPEHDAEYDKIGEASWYGPGFHGKRTANGEKFNQNDLTAAHPTLPMPSLVRVTNLQNGKSMIVRINDRGPFKSNRIIDLSKASAQRLGIHSLAQVRVQYLPRETEQYIASLNGSEPLDMVAVNDRPPSAEIVETTVAAAEPGDTTITAAPVLTVSSNDIAGGRVPASPPPAVIAESKPQPVTLVRQAWADDNVTLPEPGAPVVHEETAEQAVEETAVAEEKPAPVQKPAAVSDKQKFVIQAGSFASQENAKKLASKLSSAGKTLVEKVPAAGKMWWRVRVGPFSGRDAAEVALSKVHVFAPEARITRP